jgi:hypothetical protein
MSRTGKVACRAPARLTKFRLMPLHRILLFPAAVIATGLFACVTTDDGPPAAATPHLGMEAHFNEADLDKDGKLSKKDIALHYHEELLDQYDLDGDDHICDKEWRRAHPPAAQLHPRFNEIDRNKDGRLSKSEAVTWVSEHISLGDAFKKYDQDGDFSLHWKELNANAPTELRVTMFSLPLG